jgi:hypothetical protein
VQSLPAQPPILKQESSGMFDIQQPEKIPEKNHVVEKEEVPVMAIYDSIKFIVKKRQGKPSPGQLLHECQAPAAQEYNDKIHKFWGSQFYETTFIKPTVRPTNNQHKPYNKDNGYQQ